MKTVVVVPTYNERTNLSPLIEQIRSTLPAGHILVVDDNSPDGTGELADRLADEDNHVHVLHRSEKQGLGRAYQAGFGWALNHGYDLICSMDADFSHDPADLPRLIERVKNGADIAVGSRYLPGGKVTGWSWDRFILSYSANFITKLFLGLKPHDVTAGFKCYRRAFLQSFDLNEIVSPGYAFQVEMLAQAQYHGFKIEELPITFRDRTVGRSKVSRHELLTSARSLLELFIRRRGVRELGKFGLVGITNLAVDLGVTNLLVLVFRVAPTIAGYAGVLVALTNSFIFNRRWTFQVASGHVGKQFFRFFLVNGSGALFHSLIYTFLLVHYNLYYNFAKLLAITVAMAWNFLGTKYWVFRKK